MLDLVVSTRNRDKLAELLRLLADLDVTLTTAAEAGVPEVDETGATLEDNALLKAAAAWRHTGLPALADDTGLLVDALNGAPGVFSARFAGEDATYADNVRRLLAELAGVAAEDRTAHFVSSLVLVVPRALAVPAPKGAPWRVLDRDDVPAGAVAYGVEGRVSGRILDAARGAGGFGYDPVFYYPPLDQTFAEMALADKNEISHRGRAYAALRGCLQALVG